jgi:hypothetical protein
LASSSWIGVTAGLTSAAITLSAGFFLEDYRRHRDRQAMAMAFVGEIKTLVDLSKRLALVEKAKMVADMLRPLGTLPVDYGGPERTIGNPVFDKAADKIGIFPDDIPMLISEFYNYLVGLRIAYFGALASGPMSVQGRVNSLDFVVSAWPEMETLASSNLLPKLMAVAADKWRLRNRLKAALSAL